MIMFIIDTLTNKAKDLFCDQEDLICDLQYNLLINNFEEPNTKYDYSELRFVFQKIGVLENCQINKDFVRISYNTGFSGRGMGFEELDKNMCYIDHFLMTLIEWFSAGFGNYNFFKTQMLKK